MYEDLLSEAEIRTIRTFIINAFNFQKKTRLLKEHYTYRFIEPRENYRIGLILERNASYGKNSVIRTYIDFHDRAYPTIPEYRVENFQDVQEGSDAYYVGFMLVPRKDFPHLSKEGVSFISENNFPQYPKITAYLLNKVGGNVTANLTWEQTGRQPTTYRLYLSKTSIFSNIPTVTGIDGNIREYELPAPSDYDVGQLFVKLESVYGLDKIFVKDVAELTEDADLAYKIVTASPNVVMWTSGPDFSPLVGTSYNTLPEVLTALQSYVPIDEVALKEPGLTPGVLLWSSAFFIRKDADIENEIDLYTQFGYTHFNVTSREGFEGGRTYISTIYDQATGVNPDFPGYADIGSDGLSLIYAPNVYVTGPFPNPFVPVITSFTYTGSESTLTGHLTWTQEGDVPLHYNLYFATDFGVYLPSRAYLNISNSAREANVLIPDIAGTRTIYAKLVAVYPSDELETDGYSYIDYVKPYVPPTVVSVQAVISRFSSVNDLGITSPYGPVINQTNLLRETYVYPTDGSRIYIWQGDKINLRARVTLSNGTEQDIIVSAGGMTVTRNYDDNILTIASGDPISRLTGRAGENYGDGIGEVSVTVNGVTSPPVEIGLRYIESQILHNKTFDETTQSVRLANEDSIQLTSRVTLFPENVSFNVTEEFIGSKQGYGTRIYQGIVPDIGNSLGVSFTEGLFTNTANAFSPPWASGYPDGLPKQYIFETYHLGYELLVKPRLRIDYLPPTESFRIVSASSNPVMWTAGPDFSSLVNTEYPSEESLKAAMLALIPVGEDTGHVGGVFVGIWGPEVVVARDGNTDTEGSTEAFYMQYGYVFNNRASNVGFEGGRTFFAGCGNPDLGYDVTYDIDSINFYYTPNVYVTGPFRDIYIPTIGNMSSETGELTNSVLVSMEWTQDGTELPTSYNVYFKVGFDSEFPSTPSYTSISGTARQVSLEVPVDFETLYSGTIYIYAKLEAVFPGVTTITNGSNSVDYTAPRYTGLRVETIIYSTFAKDTEGENVYYEGFSNAPLLQRTIAIDPTNQDPIPIWEGDEVTFRVYGLLVTGGEEIVDYPDMTVPSNLYQYRYYYDPVEEVGVNLHKAQVGSSIYEDPDNVTYNDLNQFRFAIDTHEVFVPFFIRYCTAEVISSTPFTRDVGANRTSLEYNQTTQLDVQLTVYPERTSFNVDPIHLNWGSLPGSPYTISSTGLMQNTDPVAVDSVVVGQFIEGVELLKFSIPRYIPMSVELIPE